MRASSLEYVYYIGLTDEGHEGSYTWLSDGTNPAKYFWGKVEDLLLLPSH